MGRGLLRPPGRWEETGARGGKNEAETKGEAANELLPNAEKGEEKAEDKKTQEESCPENEEPSPEKEEVRPVERASRATQPQQDASRPSGKLTVLVLGAGIPIL